MSKTKAVLNSAIVLYFVICFEILIMISPFAGFFYSAFNPVLLGFERPVRRDDHMREEERTEPFRSRVFR